MAFGIDDAIAEGLKIVNKFIPDGDARAEASEKLTQTITDAYGAGLRTNAETNKVEAAHPSIFVAGWRPAIGWTCAIVLFTWYVPMALVSIGLWIYAVIQAGGVIPPRPDIGMAEVMGLVMSMLGIGGLRTVEKIKGVDSRGVLRTVLGALKK